MSLSVGRNTLNAAVKIRTTHNLQILIRRKIHQKTEHAGINFFKAGRNLYTTDFIQ